jgi:phenylacetic acid degradation operon negative regulatory protein
LGNDAIRCLVFDPLLPEPLADVSERRAFVDTVLEFDRVGRLIWLKRSSPQGAEDTSNDALTHH